MLYGEPGAGKTTFYATALWHPDLHPMLIFKVEGGLMTIQDLDLPVEPMVVDIEGNVGAFEEVYWKLRQGNDPVYAGVKTIVVDSGSELQTLALEQEVHTQMIKEQGNTRKKSSHDNLDDIWLDDQGTITKRVARWYRYLRNLPQNVVITAHDRKTYPRLSNEQRKTTDVSMLQPTDVGPNFGPALRRHVQGYFDWVWYIWHDQNNPEAPEMRRILTQKRGVFFAKTRGHKFAQSIGPVVDWHVKDDGTPEPILAQIYEHYKSGGKYQIPRQAHTGMEAQAIAAEAAGVQKEATTTAEATVAAAQETA